MPSRSFSLRILRSGSTEPEAAPVYDADEGRSDDGSSPCASERADMVGTRTCRTEDQLKKLCESAEAIRLRALPA